MFFGLRIEFSPWHVEVLESSDAVSKFTFAEYDRKLCVQSFT